MESEDSHHSSVHFLCRFYKTEACQLTQRLYRQASLNGNNPYFLFESTAKRFSRLATSQVR